jgi:hypothetical protein
MGQTLTRTILASPQQQQAPPLGPATTAINDDMATST